MEERRKRTNPESIFGIELGKIINSSNVVLEACSPQSIRVEEENKKTIESIFSNVIRYAEQLKNGELEKQKGLELIFLELNRVRGLVSEGKIDSRSLVADRHLGIEAKVKSLKEDLRFFTQARHQSSIK